MIRADQKVTKIEFTNLEFSIHPSCTLTFLVIIMIKCRKTLFRNIECEIILENAKFLLCMFLNINAINR